MVVIANVKIDKTKNFPHTYFTLVIAELRLFYLKQNRPNIF